MYILLLMKLGNSKVSKEVQLKNPFVREVSKGIYKLDKSIDCKELKF